ncbi:MAG: hypothetical protein A2Y10_12945 [Planctomycetes bacterium GWF2_41_51]|nr:MAG: hypothetical protein A2Y10_12945 [Planctomycetes bacterium GWF2_41_51]HBG28220.1 hypothetical protein [Phycisphaerales bacterium]
MKKLVIMMILCTSNFVFAGVYDDAVGYWQFEEGSGQTIADITGNGNGLVRGTNAMEESKDAQWSIGGGIGGSNGVFSPVTPKGMVSTGGDNDAFDVSPDSSFSVSLWFKNTPDVIKDDWLVSKSESTANYRGWGFGVNAAGQIEFLIRSTNTTGDRLWGKTGQTVASMTDNWASGLEYVNIVMTYNGGMTLDGFKFYVDGVQMNATLYTDADSGGSHIDIDDVTTNDKPLDFGGRNTAATVSGYYDDCAFWDRELTATEVGSIVPEPATIIVLALGGFALIRKK